MTEQTARADYLQTTGKTTLMSWFTSLGYKVRQSFAGEILTRAGVLPFARRAFQAVEYRLSGGVYECSLSDHEIKYKVADANEYSKLRHLARTESTVLEEFATTLQPSDTVYDIGAHLGLYTILAEQLVNDGSVFAFELMAPNARRLKKTVSPDITQVVTAAVSDTSGEGYHSFPKEEPGEVGTSLNEAKQGEIDASTITIDEFAATHPIPNIVKIDVEGHERAVLRGGKRTFSNDSCRAIFLETHGKQMIEDIKQQLNEFGFSTIETLDERGPQLFLKATRTK